MIYALGMTDVGNGKGRTKGSLKSFLTREFSSLDIVVMVAAQVIVFPTCTDGIAR